MFIELGYFECISSARSRSTEFRCCQDPKINYLQFYIAVLKLDHKSAGKRYELGNITDETKFAS